MISRILQFSGGIESQTTRFLRVYINEFPTFEGKAGKPASPNIQRKGLNRNSLHMVYCNKNLSFLKPPNSQLTKQPTQVSGTKTSNPSTLLLKSPELSTGTKKHKKNKESNLSACGIERPYKKQTKHQTSYNYSIESPDNQIP